MLWLTKFKNNSNYNKGFSLLEVVVALGVFILISTSLLMLFHIALKITNDNKIKGGALVIAQQQMEILKNLPYNDIGTVGGVPAGDIESSQTITMNNIAYAIINDIRYVDDEFDGTIGDGDTLNIDYKKITVNVNWDSNLSGEPIELVSNIAPRDIEQSETGDTGTLWIEVYDSEAQAVANANISIVNNDLSPVVSISGTTDVDGFYMLPGTPIATQSYEISVTKSGYSTDQTYDEDLVTNPNPDPAHLSVDIDDVTNKSFFIDSLSNLDITAYEYGTTNIISGFDFTLIGEKTIGSDGEGSPIHKYSESQTTDGSGNVSLADMEYDTYSINFDNASTGYDLAGSNLDVPLILEAGTTSNLELYLAPHSTHTFLLSIKDSGNLPVSDANVQLYDGVSYDETKTSDIFGQAFFTPLSATTYYLEVTKTGYIDYNLEINVDDQTTQTITLTEI